MSVSWAARDLSGSVLKMLSVLVLQCENWPLFSAFAATN